MSETTVPLDSAVGTPTASDDGTGTAAPRDLAGKYLTFYLGSEEYGLEILKVREIMGMMPITAVPRTPPAIRGIINLRGKVIPVVDLRVMFDMGSREETAETCIIVVQAQDAEMGVVVDRVFEVTDIAAADIQDPPSFGEAVDADYILGIGKSHERVSLLLDIERVLCDVDAGAFHAMA